MDAMPKRRGSDTPKPPWLKVRAPDPEKFARVRRILAEGNVNTVCDVSHCPNISECWSTNCATFMILGRVCTRNCRFCAVESGDPGGAVDASEPERIGKAVNELGLAYAVVTSVTRDDLDDFGAAQFAAVVREIRRASPGTRIELLIPDLQADETAIATVVNSEPDVIGHNLETVKRLQPEVRDPRADYDVSLQVLRRIKNLGGGVPTKSSMMLGLGETMEEVVEAMRDLLGAGVDALTLGQYLRPGKVNIEVKEYVSPEDFNKLREEALRLGFDHVAAGPLVRSSYRAFEFMDSRNEGV